MSREKAFIDLLRGLATDPAARGLMDDAAVLPGRPGDLVLTHDMLVEGVHYLADDDAADVAWKLIAVNLSDLAAKGATPLGLLLGYAMTGDAAWDGSFAAGLGVAADHFAVPLLGGDTVRLPEGSARVLGLTAIGEAPPGGAPSRAGARPGDILHVSGTLGDAALGLAIRQGKAEGHPSLVQAYLRPEPRVDLGSRIVHRVSAMADVSDGLLIDAARMAEASGCAIHIDLADVPLSPAFAVARGIALETRMFAATSGDDYELLCTAPEQLANADLAAIGRVETGAGLRLSYAGERVALPARLGYEHG